MKVVESSALRGSGRKKGSREDGKSIENRTQPELGPNRASKSTIVRGALISFHDAMAVLAVVSAGSASHLTAQTRP